MTNGFTTDGQISAMKLVRLLDDKNFWPPYRVAPVIRKDIAQNYPGIVQILNAVTALLTDEGQADLHWRVDGLLTTFSPAARARAAASSCTMPNCIVFEIQSDFVTRSFGLVRQADHCDGPGSGENFLKILQGGGDPTPDGVTIQEAAPAWPG